MSGGVDSSVSAALLKKSRLYAKLRRDFDIIGVFMRFYEDDKLEGAWNRCCSPEAAKRASWVAKSLGIPFYIFDFSKEFKEKIITYFLDGYKKGLTPNPCVICNEEIKLIPRREMTLEFSLEFIEKDELVEVTPKNIRLRKRYLTENERKSHARGYSRTGS